MVIHSIAPTSYSGMYKIVPQEGAAFFIRPEYLISLDFDSIQSEVEMDEDETNELLDAGFTAVVELKAVDYLARAEQSRFGLTRKLLQKKYDKKYIDKALTCLESKNYLSDQRYAIAWLHTRRINHCEGRVKLIAELQNRGIDKETAQKAVNEFFEEYNEEEICLKACNKYIKKGKDGDKLITSLLNAGFSYKMIKQVMENNCIYK